ncbi:hypothetical protein [Desulfofundulus thermocisternus]|uniref:hypothetical protein n=1 Tax=Desulfofundulus thermocisternus TaxID=42471 RepID=UPI00217D9CBE|nr:hypothetical protein [Desulfofundulus thermocisternus]
MKIFVNGTEVTEEFLSPPLPGTMAGAVEGVSLHLWQRGLVIESIQVDRRDYGEARADEDDAGNGLCLEIRAGRMPGALVDIARALAELLPTVVIAAHEICQLLEEKQVERAMAGLVDLADALESIRRAFVVASELLPNREYFPFSRAVSEMEGVYPLMVRALDGGDLTALCHIMRDSLIPVLQGSFTRIRPEPAQELH